MKYHCFSLISIICALCGTGCAGFSQQPVFTDIIGSDSQPIKLIKTVQTETNVLHVYFSGQTELIRAEIFMPETGQTQACTVENVSADEDSESESLDQQTAYTAFAVTPTAPIGIGEAFVLRGSVSDAGHSMLDFALPFTGANTHPARLRITELRPLYGSKPKSEFIEFIVQESGNLSGITITNVGDKKAPHYSFPPAEVAKGEVIVYHWRSIEDGIQDETSRKIISGGTQACAAARDFWGPYKSIPRKNANVILIKSRKDGDVQDAILYCTEKEFAKRGYSPSWNDENLTQDAETAVTSGVWFGSALLKGAVIAPITASKSLVRNTKSGMNKADTWSLRTSKAMTMGQAY